MVTSPAKRIAQQIGFQEPSSAGPEQLHDTLSDFLVGVPSFQFPASSGPVCVFSESSPQALLQCHPRQKKLGRCIPPVMARRPRLGAPSLEFGGTHVGEGGGGQSHGVGLCPTLEERPMVGQVTGAPLWPNAHSAGALAFHRSPRAKSAHSSMAHCLWGAERMTGKALSERLRWAEHLSDVPSGERIRYLQEKAALASSKQSQGQFERAIKRIQRQAKGSNTKCIFNWSPSLHGRFKRPRVRGGFCWIVPSCSSGW